MKIRHNHPTPPPPRISSMTQALAIEPEAGRMAGIAWALLVLTLAASMFSIALAQAACLISIVAWLATGRQWRWNGWTPLLIHTPFILFVLARVVSVPLSTRPDLSVASLNREMAFYLIYPMAIAMFSFRLRDRLKIVFRILFWASVASALVGIVRYGIGDVERAASTSAGYYTLGAFLSMGIAGTAALWRNRNVFPKSWIPLAGIAVMGAGLLLTFNRMHWAAVAVALAIYGLRKERRMTLVAIACAAAFVLLVPRVRDRVLTFTNVSENASGRDVIFRGAWMLVAGHPVTGYGPRTFREIFPLWNELEDKGVANWHNDFVQTYLESGIIALLAYLALFIQAFVLCRRMLRRARDAAESDGYEEAFLSIMIVFAISGCTYDSLPAIWFRLVLAGIIGLYAQKTWMSNASPAHTVR